MLHVTTVTVKIKNATLSYLAFARGEIAFGGNAQSLSIFGEFGKSVSREEGICGAFLADGGRFPMTGDNESVVR